MIHNDLKFFTNEPERNLYDRFNKILKRDTEFFDVLVGYFRASGFYLLQDVLDNVSKTRILIGINTMQYVAPAQNLVKVIREKNHKLIPIVTTVLGALCSGGWLLFGLIVGDINSIISNGLGCLSSIITTIIWTWIYTKYGKNKKEEEEGKELIETTENEESKNN